MRISDNADTLFHAMTVGVAPSASRGKRLATIATDHHVHLRKQVSFLSPAIRGITLLSG